MSQHLREFDSFKDELKRELAEFEEFGRVKHRQITWLTRMSKFFKILYVPGVILAVIAAILPFLAPVFAPVIIAALLVFIFDIVMWRVVFKDPDTQYINRFKNDVIGGLLKKMDPQFTYQPKESVNPDVVKESALFGDFDKCRGEDLVTGRIGNVDVLFSELHLYTEDNSFFDTFYDSFLSSTDTGTRYKLMFRGLFMAADFHKSFKGRVLVLPKRDAADNGLISRILGGSRYTGLDRQTLENPALTENFEIRGSNPQLTNYVLSPLIQQRIVDMSEHYTPKVYCSFIHGRMYMAIGWRKDLFEADLEKGVPTIEDLKTYYDEVLLFEKLVTAMDLNTRIWGAKAMQDYDGKRGSAS